MASYLPAGQFHVTQRTPRRSTGSTPSSVDFIDEPENRDKFREIVVYHVYMSSLPAGRGEVSYLHSTFIYTKGCPILIYCQPHRFERILSVASEQASKQLYAHHGHDRRLQPLPNGWQTCKFLMMPETLKEKSIQVASEDVKRMRFLQYIPSSMASSVW